MMNKIKEKIIFLNKMILNVLLHQKHFQLHKINQSLYHFYSQNIQQFTIKINKINNLQFNLLFKEKNCNYFISARASNFASKID